MQAVRGFRSQKPARLRLEVYSDTSADVVSSALRVIGSHDVGMATRRVRLLGSVPQVLSSVRAHGVRAFVRCQPSFRTFRRLPAVLDPLCWFDMAALEAFWS